MNVKGKIQKLTIFVTHIFLFYSDIVLVSLSFVSKGRSVDSVSGLGGECKMQSEFGTSAERLLLRLSPPPDPLPKVPKPPKSIVNLDPLPSFSCLLKNADNETPSVFITPINESFIER